MQLFQFRDSQHSIKPSINLWVLLRVINEERVGGCLGKFTSGTDVRKCHFLSS